MGRESPPLLCKYTGGTGCEEAPGARPRSRRPPGAGRDRGRALPETSPGEGKAQPLRAAAVSAVPSRREDGGSSGRQRGASATAVGGGRGAGECPDRAGLAGEAGVDAGSGGRAAAADGAEAAGFGRGGAGYSGRPGETVPQPRGDRGSGGEAAGEVAEGVRSYPRRAGAAGEAVRPGAAPGAASRTAPPAGPLQGAHLPGETRPLGHTGKDCCC